MRGACCRGGGVLCVVWTVAAGLVTGCGNAPATPAGRAPSDLYSSKTFSLPLTIRTDGMRSPPEEDSRNLLAFDAVVPGPIRKDGHEQNNQFNKVRFLVPVIVYPHGSAASEKPPGRYLHYLRSLAEHGASFSHVTALRVDGRPATVMTARTRHGMDGSIGCQDVRAPSDSEACFGLQSDTLFRIAVVHMGHTPLVAWARTSAREPDRPLFGIFERMLTSIGFR
jgi:hypothetical protein